MVECSKAREHLFLSPQKRKGSKMRKKDTSLIYSASLRHEILMGLLLVMILAGCGTSAPATNTASPPDRETPVSQQPSQSPAGGVMPDPQQTTPPQSKAQSLTEAQRKIDSQLLAAIQQTGATTAAPQLQQIEIGADGKTQIEIRAEVSDQLVDQITALGADVTATNAAYRSISAQAPLDQIETIAGFPEVLFIIPASEGTTNTP
jgi:hypothetical protein